MTTIQQLKSALCPLCQLLLISPIEWNRFGCDVVDTAGTKSVSESNPPTEIRRDGIEFILGI